MMRAWVFMLVALFSVTAVAQDDEDDLAPLAPLPKKAPAKPKPAPKPKPKPKPKADDDLAPLAPLAKTGELTVKVAGGVSRATLAIDGKEVGQLPLAPQTIPAGEHTLTVRRPGYTQFVKKVTLGAGKQLEVEAKLTAVSAVISVKSDVSNAQVLVNGRLIGTAPVSDYEFPAGPVTISVIKEGFKEDKQKLTLVAGKDYPIEVRFKPPEVAQSDRPTNSTLTPAASATAPVDVKSSTEPALYQRWYFWAGVAAVVVAVAAVSIYYSIERKLSPEEICLGPCDSTVNAFRWAASYHPLLSSPTRFQF